MTRAEIRAKGHWGLEIVEWLNTHAQARSIKLKDQRAVEFAIRDLRKIMLQLIDTAVREEELNLEEDPLAP